MILDPELTKITYEKIVFVRKNGVLKKIKQPVELTTGSFQDTKPMFPVDPTNQGESECDQ
jgi:hypothetical protein